MKTKTIFIISIMILGFKVITNAQNNYNDTVINQTIVNNDSLKVSLLNSNNDSIPKKEKTVSQVLSEIEKYANLKLAKFNNHSATVQEYDKWLNLIKNLAVVLVTDTNAIEADFKKAKLYIRNIDAGIFNNGLAFEHSMFDQKYKKKYNSLVIIIKKNTGIKIGAEGWAEDQKASGINYQKYNTPNNFKKVKIITPFDSATLKKMDVISKAMNENRNVRYNNNNFTWWQVLIAFGIFLLLMFWRKIFNNN